MIQLPSNALQSGWSSCAHAFAEPFESDELAFEAEEISRSQPKLTSEQVVWGALNKVSPDHLKLIAEDEKSLRSKDVLRFLVGLNADSPSGWTRVWRLDRARRGDIVTIEGKGRGDSQVHILAYAPSQDRDGLWRLPVISKSGVTSLVVRLNRYGEPIELVGRRSQPAIIALGRPEPIISAKLIP